MALRKKLKPIQRQKPDILVVPESEHPDKINFEKYDLPCTGSVWVGDNPQSYVLRIFFLMAAK